MSKPHYSLIKKYMVALTNIWDKILKNGPSEVCGRQL